MPSYSQILGDFLFPRTQIDNALTISGGSLSRIALSLRLCSVPGEKAAVACRKQSPQPHQRHPGTGAFPSIFGGNLITTFKRQLGYIFPKIEPRRALKLWDTGTHPSPPPHRSAKGFVPCPLLRLYEMCSFYSTQVLSKKIYILFCETGQKTLS